MFIVPGVVDSPSSRGAAYKSLLCRSYGALYRGGGDYYKHGAPNGARKESAFGARREIRGAYCVVRVHNYRLTVDSALSKVFRSGELPAMFVKWFGRPPSAAALTTLRASAMAD